MKLHIMTWNCALYREIPMSLNWMRYNSIVNIVKGRLELKNSMVVLQEIPYKSKETWSKHPFYLQLVKDFPEDIYKMVFSIADENQIMMTVVIFKKDVFEETNDEDEINNKIKNNRTACCKIEDIILVGVHMPTDFKIKMGDNEKTRELKKWKEGVWDNLIDFAKEKKLNNQKIIILGDFNAFIGCEDTLTENKFIELCRYADDIIPDDISTYNGGTAIDHVFVNFNTTSNYVQLTEEEFEWSDHKYIAAEFNMYKQKD